jgi:hypothetical protein
MHMGYYICHKLEQDAGQNNGTAGCAGHVSIQRVKAISNATVSRLAKAGHCCRGSDGNGRHAGLPARLHLRSISNDAHETASRSTTYGGHGGPTPSHAVPRLALTFAPLLPDALIPGGSLIRVEINRGESCQVTMGKGYNSLVIQVLQRFEIRPRNIERETTTRFI